MNPNSPRMKSAKDRLKDAMTKRPWVKVVVNEEAAKQDNDEWLHGPKDGFRILAQRDPNWTGD